jgi:hypothetical protein
MMHRNSVVWVHDREIVVRFPLDTSDLSLVQHIQTESDGAQPASLVKT